jgi:Gas vesicle synthesis protein GvpL/GvpF/Lsr2
MATVTEVTLTCDVCGDAKDVKTRLFGLDGKAYEIDLCSKDADGLSRVTAGYVAKARKVTTRSGYREGQGRHGRRRPVREATGAGAVVQTARRQQKGIYVYGVLPADIEVTADVPGVGEHPGLLRVVRFDGLAALISEVDVPGRLGSADDLRTYREILDATAVEMPVLPLRFGTVLASEDAVAEELLAARREEFAAALEKLEGRAEFQVKGRYVKAAVLGEVVSRDKKAARLREASHGQDPDAARQARLELGRFLSETATASREQDTRAVRRAMDRLCVASIVREPARELDAVDMAFLVALNQERDVERAIEDLAREWEGRIEVQLLGPMAAYDFAGTVPPDN